MKKTMPRLITAILFVGIVLCLPGCSRGPKKPDGMPKLHATEITVSSESGPVADAIVSLYPADGTRAKWGSGGRTDTQGVARIKTHGQFDGVPEGEYKIVVKKAVSEGEAPPPMGTDEESQRVYEEYMKSGKRQVFFSVIDSQFDTAKQTPLEMEVTARKLNSKTADVGTLVKIEMKSSSATAN